MRCQGLNWVSHMEGRPLFFRVISGPAPLLCVTPHQSPHFVLPRVGNGYPDIVTPLPGDV